MGNTAAKTAALEGVVLLCSFRCRLQHCDRHVQKPQPTMSIVMSGASVIQIAVVGRNFLFNFLQLGLGRITPLGK